MAQNPPNFSTWSSSSDANLCFKFEDCSYSMRDSAMSTDLDQSAWLQLERVTAFHHPTRIQLQRPDVLGSIDSQYDSGQVLKFQPALDEISYDLPHGIPEVSLLDPSVGLISRSPSRARSHEFPEFDHHQVEAPARKIKTGRRRRMSECTPDGWVASKNLISERRRREKLQKGLIALRELVPMFTMKVSSTLLCGIHVLFSLQINGYWSELWSHFARVSVVLIYSGKTVLVPRIFSLIECLILI